MNGTKVTFRITLECGHTLTMALADPPEGILRALCPHNDHPGPLCDIRSVTTVP